MRRLAVLAVALPLCAAASAADAPLSLHFQERPPYSTERAPDRVEGLVATPAADALRAAGVPFRWVRTPGQRQLALIQSGSGRHCGLGWFRNAERAARGHFSRALYRDQPFAALVRAELPIASGIRTADLVADARHPVLLKEGFSYGPELDALLARAAAPVRTAAEAAQLPGMVRGGRAAWMIVAPEEADQLGGPGLRTVRFGDAPPGQTRHLYCSHDVPADWMARIDRAIHRASARRP